MMNEVIPDWQKDFLARFHKKTKSSKIEITDPVKDRLKNEFRGDVLYDEPMKNHSYIKIGGPADLFVKPLDLEDLESVVQICQEEGLPYLFWGCGSNSLVKDGGVRAVVIHVANTLNKFEVIDEEKSEVYVEAGVKLTSLVNHCLNHQLKGMEGLVGIPGSVGGAVVMNAGARGFEMQDLIRSITVIDNHGVKKTIAREKLDFHYRELKIPKTWVVVSAILKLAKDLNQESAELVKDYQKKRATTQPLKYPNLGSVFKNPKPALKGKNGIYAGQIIEDLGLKKVRVGGARISELHGNFIINENQATAKDVLALINLVKDRVYQKLGIKLLTEIKIIGED